MLRIGMVLSGKGGALPRMLPPFRMGVGGRLGHGRQWMSWITLDDLIALFLHALTTESLRGPVNAVAPNPVTNAEFTRALGAVLHRPTLFPVPAFVVRDRFRPDGRGTAAGEQSRGATSGAGKADFSFDIRRSRERWSTC